MADKVNIADEIVADGAGLVEPDTPLGTLRLLERWLATPEAERAEMRQRALGCFHQRYDMRENAKTIIRLFEIAEPGGRGARRAGEPPR